MNKAFIFIAAMLPCVAAAQTFEMQNEGGGKIVIAMDRKCKNHKDLHHAFTYHSNGRYAEGCWAYFDDLIHVVWDTPYGKERRVYSPDSFIKVGGEENKAKKGTQL